MQSSAYLVTERSESRGENELKKHFLLASGKFTNEEIEKRQLPELSYDELQKVLQERLDAVTQNGKRQIVVPLGEVSAFLSQGYDCRKSWKRRGCAKAPLLDDGNCNFMIQLIIEFPSGKGFAPDGLGASGGITLVASYGKVPKPFEKRISEIIDQAKPQIPEWILVRNSEPKSTLFLKSSSPNSIMGINVNLGGLAGLSIALFVCSCFIRLQSRSRPPGSFRGYWIHSSVHLHGDGFTGLHKISLKAS